MDFYLKNFKKDILMTENDEEVQKTMIFVDFVEMKL